MAKSSLAAWLDAFWVAKLSLVAVFAARLLLEDRFRLAFSEAALELVPVLGLEELEVDWAATAPSEAVVLFAAVPTPLELLPPPEEMLLSVELPNVLAVPLSPAAAKFESNRRLPCCYARST